MIRISLVWLFSLFLVNLVSAGPFDNRGIPESEIRVWANGVTAYSPTSSGSAEAVATHALGRPDGEFASLGDLDETQIAAGETPGSITLSLPYAITNGEDWDFAVFENASKFFDDPFIFAELAYVEVSSNGTDFLRFPATSLNVAPGTGTADTDLMAEFGSSFAGANTTNISNLAGIHPAGVGTGFDLSVLTTAAASVNIDLNAIAYVRIVDVPGDGSFLDVEGRGILDAWPTASPTGGFDLDALGTRYPVPEPAVGGYLVLGLLYMRWLRR